MTEKKRNKSKNPVINSKGSKSLKDFIKKVFMHALVEKEMSEERFDEVINDKNFFLEIFSPWHKGNKGGDLIEDFIKHIDNQNINKDFSWLNILNVDKRWKKFLEKNPEWNKLEDKNKYLNMRYQIPTHFHGNIDEAVIFHCMENPRGYLGSYGDNQIDSGLGKVNLIEYYKKTYKLLNSDNNAQKNIKNIQRILTKFSKDSDIYDVREIIQDRYQLDDVNEENIENIIYNDKKSVLRYEFDRLFLPGKFDFCNKENKKKKELLKDYYYLKEYYSQLIQTNKKLDFKKLQNKKNEIKDIADKICNLEIYPFSCAQPALGIDGIGKNILLHSDLSRLGVYIILRRIYIYLNSKSEKEKPAFVFRKYIGAWEELIKTIFDEIGCEDFNKNIIKELENNFFYCQLQPIGGGITDGNVLSVPNYKKFIYLKKVAFEKVSTLLPRID